MQWKNRSKKWDYLPRPRYGLSLRCFCHGRTVTTVSLWGSLSPGVLQPILLRERLGLFTLGGFKLETYQRNNEHYSGVEAHSCLSHKKALFPIVLKFRKLVGIQQNELFLYGFKSFDRVVAEWLTNFGFLVVILSVRNFWPVLILLLDI